MNREIKIGIGDEQETAHRIIHPDESCFPPPALYRHRNKAAPQVRPAPPQGRLQPNSATPWPPHPPPPEPAHRTRSLHER